MSVSLKGCPFRARMMLRISLGEKGEEGRFLFGDFRKLSVSLSGNQAVRSGNASYISVKVLNALVFVPSNQQ
jgi:hypothetical protein